MERAKSIKHQYEAVKFNKCDTQYQLVGKLPEQSWLTERVKVEAFQGFSRAYNIAEYFRTRGEKSWKSGIQVTGLWKSDFENCFYGDKKSKIDKKKTLILFFRSPDAESLTIHIFPRGYYPSKKVINQLISQLK